MWLWDSILNPCLRSTNANAPLVCCASQCCWCFAQMTHACQKEKAGRGGRYSCPLLDSANRRSQSALQDEYWNRRHAYAKQHLKSNDPVESIDAIIGQRINAENEVRANVKSIDSDDTFFHDHVQPILQSNCGRCHGEKQKGELSVLDRENEG